MEIVKSKVAKLMLEGMKKYKQEKEDEDYDENDFFKGNRELTLEKDFDFFFKDKNIFSV